MSKIWKWNDNEKQAIIFLLNFNFKIGNDFRD